MSRGKVSAECKTRSWSEAITETGQADGGEDRASYFLRGTANPHVGACTRLSSLPVEWMFRISGSESFPIRCKIDK
jgi:hypothetical protein